MNQKLSINSRQTPQIVCPWCGRAFPDTDRYLDDPEFLQNRGGKFGTRCGKCDMYLDVDVQVEVTFSTERYVEN